MEITHHDALDKDVILDFPGSGIFAGLGETYPGTEFPVFIGTRNVQIHIELHVPAVHIGNGYLSLAGMLHGTCRRFSHQHSEFGIDGTDPVFSAAQVAHLSIEVVQRHVGADFEFCHVRTAAAHIFVRCGALEIRFVAVLAYVNRIFRRFPFEGYLELGHTAEAFVGLEFKEQVSVVLERHPVNCTVGGKIIQRTDFHFSVGINLHARRTACFVHVVFLGCRCQFDKLGILGVVECGTCRKPQREYQ